MRAKKQREDELYPVAPKPESPRAGRFIMMVFILISMIVSYVMVTNALTPKRVDLKPGDKAKETLYTSRDIVDRVTTDARKQEAMREVKSVERLDEAHAIEQQQLAQVYFGSLADVREEAEKIRSQRMQLATSSSPYAKLPKEGELTEEEWRLLLKQEDYDYLRGLLPLSFADIEIEQLIAMKAETLQRTTDIVLSKLLTVLRAGVTKYSLVPTQNEMQKELRGMQLSEIAERLGDKAINAYLDVTLEVDEQATEARREQAAEGVAPVMLRKGEMIIAAGDTATDSTVGILEDLGYVRPTDSDRRVYIGSAVLLVFVFCLFAAYLLLFRSELLRRGAYSFMLGLVMLVTIVLMFPALRLNSWVNPAALGALLISLLIGPKPAMAANFLLALIGGLMAGGWSDMLGTTSLINIATYAVGGTVAVMAARNALNRGRIMISGALGGVMAALMLFALRYLIDADITDMLMSSVWVLGTYVLSAVICIGTLPLWESIFDISTPSRMRELCDANMPLLRRLMTEAPGTYHHSLMVASLAENATEAVGRDALLARAGAFYHDIGKLKRPVYFVENQRGGRNPHDQLEPEQSAKILFAHVFDGITLAEKHKLPAQLRQIIVEHHGDTAAMYFYHKAAASGPVDIKSFRYPGPRPQSAESAIVMLADSVEAGVRSLENQTREAIGDMIRKIVKSKIDDGQFSNVPLTFAELSRIEQAFLKTYGGLLHERIAYPGEEKEDKDG